MHGWRRKTEIILILIAFFFFFFVYTLKCTTPMYNSSITLILVSAKKDNETGTGTTITTSDITLNSKLIATYNRLAKSKAVLKDVISNLDLDMDENTLKNNISVSSRKNTDLIEIKVKNEDNELAAQIANELANVFIKKVEEMYNINNIQIISEASIEDEPSNINHKKDVTMFVGVRNNYSLPDIFSLLIC